MVGSVALRDGSVFFFWPLGLVTWSHAPVTPPLGTVLQASLILLALVNIFGLVDPRRLLGHPDLLQHVDLLPLRHLGKVDLLLLLRRISPDKTECDFQSC